MNPTCPNDPTHGSMQLRKSARGQFWGCTRYPNCTATKDSRAFAVHTVDADTAKANLTRVIAKLDSDQRSVLDWAPGSGELTIPAGAGAGKSSTITALTANLVAQGVDPTSIIVTTFTNKASAELRSKLSLIVPATAYEQLRIGTYHSVGQRELLKLSPKWAWANCLDIGTNIDGDGAGDGTSDSDADPSIAKFSGTLSKYQLWQKITGYAKEIPGLPGVAGLDLGLTKPATIIRLYDLIRSHLLDPLKDSDNPKVAKFAVLVDGFVRAVELYQRAKTTLNVFDFGDVIADWYTGVQTKQLTTAPIVIVDEAQDNDTQQLMLARALSDGGHSLVTVGDARQGIYGFRGANPEIFTSSASRGARIIALSSNYRSVEPIVALGNRIAVGRAWNLGGTVKTGRIAPDGDALRIICTPDPIVSAVRDMQSRVATTTTKPGDIAILCRTNAEVLAWEGVCAAMGVGTYKLGRKTLFDHSTVKSWLAYLSMLSGVGTIKDVEQTLNTPSRQITRKIVIDALRGKPMGPQLISSLRAAIVQLNSTNKTRWLGTRLSGYINDLTVLIKSPWRDDKIKSLPTVVMELITPPVNTRLAAIDPDADDRLLLTQAGNVAARFTDGASFVAFAAQCVNTPASATANEHQVTLGTIHAAKGKEWPHVYIPAGWGTFPNFGLGYTPRRAIYDTFMSAYLNQVDEDAIESYIYGQIQGKDAEWLGQQESTIDEMLTGIDEEYRVFYVACTRAMDSVTFVSPFERVSPFIEHVVPELAGPFSNKLRKVD